MQTESIVHIHSPPPFGDEIECLQWYWRQQPLGVQSVNLLEQENKPESKMKRAGHDSLDVFSAIVIALQHVHEHSIQQSWQAKEIFMRLFVGEITDRGRVLYGPEEVAEYLGCSRRTVYRSRRKLLEDCYVEFLKRNLIRKRENTTSS